MSKPKVATSLLFAVMLMLLAVVGTTTSTFIYAEKQNDNGNGDENGKGNNNDDSSDQETEEQTDDTDTETQTEETEQSAAAAAATTTAADNPNGNDDNVPGDNPQPDRVGSHDEQTSPTSNPGSTVTDNTLCDVTTLEDCSTEVDKNCFGKVISERAQDHKEDPEEGTLGSHARDPVPELPGNETPRQGIGNQDQGHPAAHGAFNSQFEDEDEQNVIDNC